MRYSVYWLGIKHLLPQRATEMANGEKYAPTYFHSVVPVGIAMISADENDSTLFIQLLDNSDAFLFEGAFMAIPPINRTRFLRMLESIGKISTLLCYRTETVEIKSTENEFFEDLCMRLQKAHIEASRSLYVEVYGRN